LNGSENSIVKGSCHKLLIGHGPHA